MTASERKRYRRRCRQQLWNIVHMAILIVFGLLILGNLANISVAQEDTLNQIMELRQEQEPETTSETDLDGSWMLEDQNYVALPLTDAERDLVTRVVMAEARGDGYAGMLPVAQTILDRATLWNMTVTAVVMAPGQYADPYQGEITFEAQLAVSDVFDLGVRAFEEPTTHFAEGRPWWTAGKESRGSIGRHQFWY